MHTFLATTAPIKPLLKLFWVTGLVASLSVAHAQQPRQNLPEHATNAVSYAQRAEVLAAAQDIAARRDLPAAWVKNALQGAYLLPNVVRLMQPAPVGAVKNWRVYRSRFLDKPRIAAGAAFWRTHRELLARAEREYGVPAEIIVGIIGVETIYGRNVGNFRVVDALATLAFDFPKTPKRDRSPFFLSELEQFLSFTYRAGLDPLALRGSYAGAMGLPQFMPSSWVKYAIDFDSDGRVDLFNSPADVIGSVANYFKAFGWQPGMPTHYEASFTASQTPDQKLHLLAPDILPTFSAAELQQHGMQLGAAAAAHGGKLALVELQNAADAPQYLLGTENFYAITRYNWSSYYALAVIELGQAVKALMPR